MMSPRSLLMTGSGLSSLLTLLVLLLRYRGAILYREKEKGTENKVLSAYFYSNTW